MNMLQQKRNSFAIKVKKEVEMFFLFKDNNARFVKNLKSSFYYYNLIDTKF